MDNGLLTFNLRVPVGLQVVSHLISENTILEQFLLILSSSLGGCKYDRYRKEIEQFTNGHLAGLSRPELQSALTLFAGKIADQILSDFVPQLAVLTGKVLPSGLSSKRSYINHSSIHLTGHRKCQHAGD